MSFVKGYKRGVNVGFWIQDFYSVVLYLNSMVSTCQSQRWWWPVSKASGFKPDSDSESERKGALQDILYLVCIEAWHIIETKRKDISEPWILILCFEFVSCKSPGKRYFFHQIIVITTLFKLYSTFQNQSYKVLCKKNK